jgi:hypothetical protein
MPSYRKKPSILAPGFRVFIRRIEQQISFVDELQDNDGGENANHFPSFAKPQSTP